MQIIKESDLNSVDLACDFLAAGKIIAFATDTVYGLAVDASNSNAVEALYKLKKRDEKKPIAIFVKDLEAAKKIFFFDEISTKLATKFLPGSLTLVLETKAEAVSGLALNLNQNNNKFLGFRVIDNDFIQNLLKKFDGILAVTSANESSQKSARSAEEVEKYFKYSQLDLLIDGGISKQETASTVVKITDGKVTILRQGLTNIADYENC